MEKAGFKLENGKHVTGGTPIVPDATTGGSIAQAPKKPRQKAEPGAKRRKSNVGKALKTEAEVKDEAGAEAEDEHAVDGQDGKLGGEPNSGGSGETA